ncbi:MAG: type 2 isopentenyl-diphosphate Delta-isomerase [Candidatus Heimdallarchaeota archaeon]|nr:type 2 isopentenyl-diphosphate Delta-isomerase [Candidatus Heimdallarchaeota archaeon]
MDQNLSSNTSSRKDDHLKICLEKDVKYTKVTSGLEKFEVNLNNLTGLSPEDINLSTSFLDKSMDFPIIIAGMTGGSEAGKRINRIIAEVCNEFNIGMGVGSQRAAIEDPIFSETYQVRDIAESIPLLANLGIAQFSSEYFVNDLEAAVEMIDADGIAIHINPLQEFIQHEGNKDLSNIKKTLTHLAEQSKYKIIVKGIGNGFSKNDLTFLASLNIYGIDIAGAGGTNWTKIELYRDPSLSEISSNLENWGIPTATCLETAIEKIPMSSKKIIASGGIWSGMDAVKALLLGADYVAFALPTLLAIKRDSTAGLKKYIQNYILEMKIVLAMLDIKNFDDLRKKKNLLMRKHPH